MSGLDALEQLRQRFGETAKDIKLNLQSILQESSLATPERYGVAIAAAAASRNPELLKAVLSDTRSEAGQAIVEDALAAAALMAMNNVYYRFRHMVGKPAYNTKSARLRMNRLGKPASSKLGFELFSLAVSAINGCESCIKAHEKEVLAGGMSEDNVHDAIRIAATIQAAAVALEISQTASEFGMT